MENSKFIHLLYVPTMACNMACKYCYLEDNTQDEYKNIIAKRVSLFILRRTKKDEL